MAQQVFPTKSNLMATKRSLALATQGYDLMDRKRNILVREMMQLIDRAAGIQDRISAAYAEAYEALKKGEKALGLFFTDSRLRRFVILIQRRGVAAVQSVAATGLYPPVSVLPSLSRLMKDGIGAGYTREDHVTLSNQLFACYAKVQDAKALASVIGEEELSQSDKQLMAFGRAFEQEFIGQGNTDRTMEPGMGWVMSSPGMVRIGIWVTEPLLPLMIPARSYRLARSEYR